MQDARALMDALMGTDRNAKKAERKGRKFSDGDICKHYLLGMCPASMFKNTKMDLGLCQKLHNEHLKEVYEGDPDVRRYRKKWRVSLRSQLRKLLADVDRRMETNAAKIEQDRKGGADKMDETVAYLKEEVSKRLVEAEGAADKGDFDGSRAIIKETEALQRRIEDYQGNTKRESVICEVCGLMVSAEEHDDILKYGRGWHTDGKQHLGFIEIRAKMKEMDEEEAQDERDGIKSASPSPMPVREHKAESNKRRGRSREAARERSPAATRRNVGAESRRRRSRSASRTARRGHSADARRRRSSRSRSRSRKRGGEAKRRSPSRRRSPRKRTRESPPKRRPSPSVDRARAPARELSPGASTDTGTAGQEASASGPVRFVLGLGKLNVTDLPSRPPPEPVRPPTPPPSPPRSRAPQRDGRHASASETPALAVPATEVLAQKPEKPETPEEPPPPPVPEREPSPPKPVRFILGLGKLSFNDLGKRGL